MKKLAKITNDEIEKVPSNITGKEKGIQSINNFQTQLEDNIKKHIKPDFKSPKPEIYPAFDI